LTRHAGSAFLEAARVLNALFFVGAAPFIYQTTRKVASKWVAVLVATLSLLDPINTYTAYFMPEGMYFFVFWWMSWYLLCRRQARPLYYGMMSGLLLAILVLVKVNAVFLLPGMMAFLVYANYRDHSPSWVKHSAVNAASFVATFAIVRFALGYLFAGKAGLQILGTRYGSLANASAAPARFSLLTSEVSGVLRGHVLGLALLFALPLASTVVILFRKHTGTEDDNALSNIAAYTLAVLLPLIVVVAYFTASVLGESPYESLGRLHMRYYNFLFPLFLMVVAGQLTARDFRRNRYVVLASVSALILLIGLAFRVLLRLYSPSLIDSPELHGVTVTSASFYLVGGLGILSLLVWAWNQRRGAQLALFLVMPIVILLSAVHGNSELRRHLAASAEDSTGRFAHDELDPLERPRLAVVGSEPAALFHVLFYVDDPKATAIVIPKGAPFDPATLPPDHDWVLLLGDHALPPDIEDKIVGEGYLLFKLPTGLAGARPGITSKTVYFSHPFRFGLVEKINGTSVSELFGRWSDGRKVQIDMSSPLPRRFNLRLTARAFGPNAGLPFTMRIGEESRTFRLSTSVGEVTLPFMTDGNARTITIEVPQPASPRQLGQGNDDRRLGIALSRMSIVADAGNFSAD